MKLLRYQQLSFATSVRVARPRQENNRSFSRPLRVHARARQGPVRGAATHRAVSTKCGHGEGARSGRIGNASGISGASAAGKAGIFGARQRGKGRFGADSPVWSGSMTHAQPAGRPSQITRPALRSPAPSGGKGKIARPAANLPRLAVEIAGPCPARLCARSGRENERRSYRVHWPAPSRS